MSTVKCRSSTQDILFRVVNPKLRLLKFRPNWMVAIENPCANMIISLSSALSFDSTKLIWLCISLEYFPPSFHSQSINNNNIIIMMRVDWLDLWGLLFLHLELMFSTIVSIESQSKELWACNTQVSSYFTHDSTAFIVMIYSRRPKCRCYQCVKLFM